MKKKKIKRENDIKFCEKFLLFFCELNLLLTLGKIFIFTLENLNFKPLFFLRQNEYSEFKLIENASLKLFKCALSRREIHVDARQYLI